MGYILRKALQYLVYRCLDIDTGEILYIGSGNERRPKHCTSGTSNNYGLNKLHFEGRSPIVEIVKRFETKKEALEYEKSLITLHTPPLNSVHVDRLSDRVQKYAISRARWDHIVGMLRANDGKYEGVRFRPIAEAIEWCLDKIKIKQLISGVDFSTSQRYPDLPSIFLRSRVANDPNNVYYNSPRAILTRYLTNSAGDIVFKENPDIDEMLDGLVKLPPDAFAKTTSSSSKKTLRRRKIRSKIPVQPRPSWVPARKGNK